MNQLNATLIGVDLGGTNMRAGRVENGRIVAIETSRVPKTDDWQVVMQQLIGIISAVWNSDVTGIGVGVPGIVDSRSGTVFDIQNIPSWVEVPVGELLNHRFNVPVFVNNDANCFAAGERFFGDGRAYDDFVGLITGTGLGAGIIKWGKLLPDQNCGAGEFGMIPYLDGIYEDYCSGQFFQRVAGIGGEELAARAAAGDAQALEWFRLYGQHLANAIKTIIFAIDPKAIIIGGSVAGSFMLYEKAMFNALADFPYSRAIQNLVVKPSGMPEVAIHGAAALCLES